MSDIEIAVLAVALVIGLVARRLVFGKPTRRDRRRRVPKQAVVTIPIRRPIIPVPSLTDAYSALPSHSWEVLGR